MKLVSWKSCLISYGSCGVTSSTSSSSDITGTTFILLDIPFGYGGSCVDLPPLVVILFTCSGLVKTSSAADNRAICIFIFFIKIKLFFYRRRKVSILAFILSKILSLETILLDKLSLILTCSKTNSLKGGNSVLEEL
jgi:hypothetical protein